MSDNAIVQVIRELVEEPRHTLRLRGIAGGSDRAALIAQAVLARALLPQPTDCPLSDRQLEVVEALSKGLTYQQIARQLGVSPSTVRTHLVNIYRILGTNDRAQAVLRAYREGWI